MVFPFKARADLGIRTDERCLPGVNLPVEVNLHLREELKPRQVRVELSGQETYYVRASHTGPKGQQQSSIVRKVATFVTVPRVLVERPSFIPNADERWKVLLLVPVDAPPSCRGKLVDVNWRIRAVLDVPLRPDQVQEVPIQVLTTSPILPVDDKESTPLVTAEKRFEECSLTLGVPLLPAGHKLIQGYLHLQTARGFQVRGIRVELVQLEDAGAKRSEEVVSSEELLNSATFSPYESRPLKFSLTLPSDAPPTTVSPHSSLRWLVRAVLDRRLHTDFNVAQEVCVYNVSSPSLPSEIHSSG